MTIRPLQKEDLDIMSTWKPFDDPLYRLFDWPKRSPRENAIWFSQLIHDSARVYYAVDNESRTLIGRISLRAIDGRRSARLGIGLGTDYVGQGYGTESLHVFLRHYFLDLGFGRMVLDVSAINQRAVRCYGRFGFRHTGSHYQYAGSDAELAFLKDERYLHLERFFKKKGRRSWMLAYDMALDKKDWLEQQEAQTSDLEEYARHVPSRSHARF